MTYEKAAKILKMNKITTKIVSDTTYNEALSKAITLLEKAAEYEKRGFVVKNPIVINESDWVHLRRH